MRLMKFKLLRCAATMVNVNENLKEEPPILILEAIISSTDNFVLEEPCSPEMDKISEDKDSSIYLLDTATKAKEDGDKLN